MVTKYHLFAVLVDLLGLDSLTSSFGMLVLCRGIASILGPPLAGLVYDLTEQYNASFYLAGAFFVTGGLRSFVAYFMYKCSCERFDLYHKILEYMDLSHSLDQPSH